MQIVIDIPEEKYDVIQSDLYNTFPAEMKEWGLEAIRNGTPLPKGHGRLIDGDELESRMNIGYRIVRNAQTIIEADKAESEDKE